MGDFQVGLLISCLECDMHYIICVDTLGLSSEKHCHVDKNTSDYYIVRESLLIPEFRHIDLNVNI